MQQWFSKFSFLAIVFMGLSLSMVQAQVTWTEANDTDLDSGKPIKAIQIREIRDAIKWGSSGSNVYRTSGNVGIGTTSPSDKLDVREQNVNYTTPTSLLTLTRTATTPTSNVNDTAGSRITFKGQDVDTNIFDIAYIDTLMIDPNYDSVGRGGDIAFSTLNNWTGSNSPTERMRITNSGNVGIGTTAPESKLHVAGGGGIRLSGDSNIYSKDWLRIYNGTGNLHIGAAENMYLNYYTGSNVFFGNGAGGATGVWKSNGNVGIGTTAPGDKLDVVGVVDSTGGYQVDDVEVIGGTGTNVYVNSRVIRNSSTVHQDGMYINYGSTGTSNADIRFYANGTTERMRIDASNGNVGIGTTAPAQKLDVAGTAQVDYLVVNPQGGSSEGGEIKLDGAGGYPDLQIDNYQGNARIHTLASGKQFQVLGGGAYIAGNVEANAYCDINGANCKTAAQMGGVSFGDNYYISAWYGSYATCGSGYVVTRVCSSGMNADCPGGFTRIRCTRIQ